MGLTVKPVGEPDAGNPPVRLDQREVETEHGMRLVRHRRGNPETEYVEAYTTAPPLDSTVCLQLPEPTAVTPHRAGREAFASVENLSVFLRGSFSVPLPVADRAEAETIQHLEQVVVVDN